MLFEENFLRLTLTECFLKTECFKKGNLSYPFQSISYNNVVVRKQIYFSPTFSKSWFYIFDNIECVVGGSQCKYKHRNFPLSDNYLDNVFAFKDLRSFIYIY